MTPRPLVGLGKRNTLGELASKRRPASGSLSCSRFSNILYWHADSKCRLASHLAVCFFDDLPFPP
jgi:hypothetical protein